jgi:hypothetical protein
MRLALTPLLLVITLELPCAELIRGLGGPEGFGENILARNDDSYIQIDVTPIWPTGLRFFGTNYTRIWLNNNGNFTFATGSPTYTPGRITASGLDPIIAAWYADVDTRAIPEDLDGQSWRDRNRTNLVYYDLDTVNGVLTATWDAVGYYDEHLDKRCSFQIRLSRYGTGSEFDIELRYNELTWTTGDASDGVDGFGGTVVRAGYSAGNGTSFFELPQSGNQAAMLALTSTAGNTGIPGIWTWRVRKPHIVITPALTHTNAHDLDFTLTVPADTTGLDVSDIVVSGGTAGALSGPNASGLDNTYVLPVSTTEGTLQITVAADAISNPFADTNDLVLHTVIVDFTAPLAPSTPTVANGVVTGTSEPFATISILLNGVVSGTTTADAAGNWSWTPANIGSGSYTLTATATDRAGNTGPASGGSPFTYTAPASDSDDACGGGIAGLLLPIFLLGLRRRRHV